MEVIYSGSHPDPGVLVVPSRREPAVEMGVTSESRAHAAMADVELTGAAVTLSKLEQMDSFAETTLSPWATVFLGLQVTPLACLYIFIFSEVGYGATVFKALAESDGAKTFAAIGVLVLVFLYVRSAP
jgi:hypothetical protein